MGVHGDLGASKLFGNHVQMQILILWVWRRTDAVYRWLIGGSSWGGICHRFIER
jgi:hypothetical protein